MRKKQGGNLLKIVISTFLAVLIICFIPLVSVSADDKNVTISEAADENIQTGGASKAIYLSNSKVTLKVGETKVIRAMSPTDVSALDITWTSGDSKIVSVSKTGTLTALAAGKTTVKATLKSNKEMTASCTVTVNSSGVTSISLSKSSTILWPGDTETIKATPVPVSSSIMWVSENNTVATVNEGKIRALKEGTVYIRAKSLDGKTVASCRVLIIKNGTKSIKLNTQSASLNIGETKTLSAITNPSGKAVSFESSNKNVATVNSSGKVTAVAAGTATITAKATDTGLTATCKITVTKIDFTAKATETTIYAGNHAYIKTSISGVSFKSSNTSVATVSSSGIVTGVKKGTATITATYQGVSKKINITVNSKPSSNITLAKSTATVVKYKSIFIKPSTSVSFKSSDTSVATVDSNGFVYAKSQGVAIITATSGGKKATCALTVSAAAPIRFAYTSPNNPAKNSTVTLVALTDKERTAVKFELTVNGKVTTINATSKTADSSNKTYLWKGTTKISGTGEFKVKAYSKTSSGAWNTCTDGEATVFVTEAASDTTLSTATRRLSDKGVNFIASYEGYVPAIYEDPLVANSPTVGYGKVITAGEQFYNNLSKEEAYGYLLQTVNKGNYVTAVNNFFKNNNIKFSQQHLDALASMAYNLGTGFLNHEDIRGVLLNCYEGGSSSSTATVNSSDGLNLRTGPGTSYSRILIMKNGTKVTIVSVSGTWYKVKLADGTVGYCSGEYLSFSGGVRNMTKVNKSKLTLEMLQYHHASGSCSKGLFNRRVDEVEIFFYNEYTRDGSSNKYNLSSRCGNFK